MMEPRSARSFSQLLAATANPCHHYRSLTFMPNIVGMENLANLGAQIAAARKSAALRQVDLAHRARVSRATVDALENGRVSDIGFVRLMRIFDSLGIGLRMEQLGDTAKTTAQPIEKVTQSATKNVKAKQCRI